MVDAWVAVLHRDDTSLHQTTNADDDDDDLRRFVMFEVHDLLQIWRQMPSFWELVMTGYGGFCWELIACQQKLRLIYVWFNVWKEVEPRECVADASSRIVWDSYRIPPGSRKKNPPGIRTESLLRFEQNPCWDSNIISPGIRREFLLGFEENSSLDSNRIPPGTRTESLLRFEHNPCRDLNRIPAWNWTESLMRFEQKPSWDSNRMYSGS